METYNMKAASYLIIKENEKIRKGEGEGFTRRMRRITKKTKKSLHNKILIELLHVSKKQKDEAANG